MLRILGFVLSLQASIAVGWSAQQKDWSDGELVSLRNGIVFETYEVLSGRCVLVGKKLRSFRHPKVTEGAPIKYALTDHWLYFIDGAGRRTELCMFNSGCCHPRLRRRVDDNLLQATLLEEEQADQKLGRIALKLMKQVGTGEPPSGDV